MDSSVRSVMTIVDSKQKSGSLLKVALASDAWQCSLCTSLDQCRDELHRSAPWIGIIVLDDEFDSQQLQEIEHFLSCHGSILWIAVLEQKLLQKRQICDLISQFFFDYHTLPLDQARLFMTLEHARRMACLYDSQSDPGFETQQSGFQFIGKSPAIVSLKRQIRKIAMTDATVLVTGESGTGKELVAKSIHQFSPRAALPFVAVNCGALPENLIQAEMFGYEKGAFTGAVQRTIGRVERAHRGTLFLDEVGDLPAAQQVNFLRFLQEGTIDRLGNPNSIPVDTRIIAATHVNLEREVRAGRFREDFFYRINVLTVNVPPLRERPEDIELLARFYFQKYTREYPNQVVDISQQALNAMRRHHWPGNVRELINRLRRAIVMCERRLIDAKDLGLSRLGTAQALPTLEEARAGAEKDVIAQCMLRSGNNISEAARLLRVSRLTLYRLMEKHGLTVSTERVRLT